MGFPFHAEHRLALNDSPSFGRGISMEVSVFMSPLFTLTWKSGLGSHSAVWTLFMASWKVLGC